MRMLGSVHKGPLHSHRQIISFSFHFFIWFSMVHGFSKTLLGFRMVLMIHGEGVAEARKRWSEAFTVNHEYHAKLKKALEDQ